MNVENVYKFRSYIRDLYKKDTTLEGDLVDSVYSIFENKDMIGRFSTDISEGYIEVVLLKESNITMDDLGKVVNEVTNSVQKFILNNIHNINVPQNEREEFVQFVNSRNSLFEHFVIGNMIKFNL